MSNTEPKRTRALIILDGWGHSEDTEYNAIHHANTPNWDHLISSAPNTLISGSGLDVGLPEGQMGNSEVGHMSLGSGRVIYQNISKIDKSISDGDFFENSAFVDAIDKAIANDGAVHLFGLLSPGGVHSHHNHILAAIKMAAKRGCKKVYLHAFLDGRDTPPRSAQASLDLVDQTFEEFDCGRTASIIGRFYAMDRDNRWDRIETAYNLLTQATAERTALNATSALQAAYAAGEDDEFVKATTIGATPVTVENGDSILFMNFRSDRARQLTKAFVDPEFKDFERNKVPQLASFVMTTEYAASIKTPCAYPPEPVVNSIGEHLANLGKTQLRIAETEKYAHVTFFFSGGTEDLYDGEQRELIPSPDVATYDLQPEMSAPELTAKLVAAIESQAFDLIVCNYANGDMVGHTGNFEAAIKAAEAIDHSVAQVVEAIRKTNGECLITADHGNCERMVDENGENHTQHTTEHVPLIYIGDKKATLTADGGKLSDIAPTLLSLMEVDIPKEMSGTNLVHSPV